MQRPPCRPSALARPLGLAGPIWVALSLLASTARAQVPPGPPARAQFEYQLVRRVGEGTGAYEGYGDVLRSSGTYVVTNTEPEGPTVQATYQWRFESSEKTDQGTVGRVVTFRLPDRRYTSAQTDLDDMDRRPADSLAAWMWIPPTVAVGDSVQVLEHTFVVRSREARFGDGTLAIELAAQGTGAPRDDAYGVFDTTYDDRYWFDTTTGMFLGSDCVEQDVGSYDGAQASFVVRESVRVITASYVTGTLTGPQDYADTYQTGGGGGSADPLSDGACIAIVGFLVLAPLAFSGLLVGWRAYRKNHPAAVVVDGRSVRFRKLPPGSPPPAPSPDATRHFAGFLERFVASAHAAGDPVAIATTGDRLAGLGIYHRDADIATILAKPTEVCEPLRSLLGANEFFTEDRHAPTAALARRAAGSLVTAELPKFAYNVYETYEVLRLSPIGDVAYDPAVVTPLTEADVPSAAKLAELVWGPPAERWLRAQLATGDFGFCVRDGGRVVGLGLATQVGAEGRVHTLAVHPDHRGKGLGKELMRARLRALADVGVTGVLAEIGTWNHASLEIARKHGFAKAGEMYVESARSGRVERKLVRR